VTGLGSDVQPPLRRFQLAALPVVAGTDRRSAKGDCGTLAAVFRAFAASAPHPSDPSKPGAKRHCSRHLSFSHPLINSTFTLVTGEKCHKRIVHTRRMEK
jgi:hypothetical protein